MNLSFVFLCLSLATLSLAAIPSGEEEGCSLSRKKPRKPFAKKVNGVTSRAANRSFQATKKKLVRNRKGAFKKRLKKRVGVTKGLKKTSAGAGNSIQEGRAAQGDRSTLALSFFPKVLVELIGGYLDDSFSVVFTRNWSAAYSWRKVAVDNERHYLITGQDVQASSHRDGEPVSLGSSSLSYYDNFHSSHDGRFLFFTGSTKKQAEDDSSDEIAARWLVQDTGTKRLKSVTLEGGETSFASSYFRLSTNGKTLLSMHCASDTETASVYQIEEHGKAALAFKKADISCRARAVSGNGNRILIEYAEKEQLEIHDVSGDESQLVLEIRNVGACIGSCALNNDGSKTAFVVNDRKLYIVDVNKEKSSISLDQLTPIDIPDSVVIYRLIYDAKNRLYVFGNGNLWLVDPSKREFISLEKTEVPQEYELQDSAVSPNGNYIALLIRSRSKNEKGEHQYQMVVKRNDRIVLMHLCRCKS